MEPITIIESIKKHGVTGLLCLCLWWMNGRLSDVEEKLYNCLTTSKAVSASKHEPNHVQLFAILPDKLKVKYGTKRKMAI
jgi:hypothetical protein